MRVLVVDGDVASAEKVAEILASAGHEADIALSAEDALVHFRIGTERIDLVVTEYRLPGATGIDLVRAIRSLGSPIPALLLTAFYDDRFADLARSAGAAAVFSKPVDFERLLSWMAARKVPTSSAGSKGG